MSKNNIDLSQGALEAKRKKNAVFQGTSKRINNQGFDISTKEKILITCTDNKRWVLDDNVFTLAFGY